MILDKQQLVARLKGERLKFAVIQLNGRWRDLRASTLDNFPDEQRYEVTESKYEIRVGLVR